MSGFEFFSKQGHFAHFKPVVHRMTILLKGRSVSVRETNWWERT